MVATDYPNPVDFYLKLLSEEEITDSPPVSKNEFKYSNNLDYFINTKNLIKKYKTI